MFLSSEPKGTECLLSREVRASPCPQPWPWREPMLGEPSCIFRAVVQVSSQQWPPGSPTNHGSLPAQSNPITSTQGLSGWYQGHLRSFWLLDCYIAASSPLGSRARLSSLTTGCSWGVCGWVRCSRHQQGPSRVHRVSWGPQVHVAKRMKPGWAGLGHCRLVKEEEARSRGWQGHHSKVPDWQVYTPLCRTTLPRHPHCDVSHQPHSGTLVGDIK